MKKYLLEGIEPVRVLRIFEDICAIPHGSRNEWRLGEYVLNIAGERGLEAQRDETGNIFIVLPATPGFEHIAPILLQGHMDMVCVKNPDCSKDLDREPIDLILDGNILRADGTSLGADNAVGLSNMIALMEEEGLLHPKIELLFTVCEEIGNEGIRRFDMTKIKARRMINMDCGDPDSMVAGSAGVSKYDLCRKCSHEFVRGKAMRIRIAGLRGGHSGIEIGKNRANAVDLAARLLSAISDEIPVRLASLYSGNSSGSIPSSIELTLVVPSDRYLRACDICAEINERFLFETALSDPGYFMSVESSDASQAASYADTRAIIDFMISVPFDVIKRSSMDLRWPLCSALLTDVNYAAGKYSAKYSIRANVDSYKYDLISRFKTLARLTDMESFVVYEAPAWPFDEESETRDLMRRVYEKIFGSELQIELVHGVVEVSTIKKAIPEMDIVGIAPKSRGAHTTGEHLYIDSMQPFWLFLKSVLAEMCAC